MNSPKFLILLIVSLVTIVSVTSTYAAAPNVWWDHLDPMSTSQSACVRKAESTLKQTASEHGSKKPGRLKVYEDSVRFRNGGIQAVVECLKSADQIMVFIMVASNNPESGNSLYGAIKKQMQMP